MTTQTATAPSPTTALNPGASPASGSPPAGTPPQNQPLISPSHNEATDKDRGIKPPSNRPEHIPENFWNKETNEADYEALGKSWHDLRKQVSLKTDDLRKQVKDEYEKERLSKRPESPEKYELKTPQNLPDGVDFQFDEADPLVKFARGFAHEQGYTQDQFDQMTAAYVESEFAKVPDFNHEMGRLGEKGKERVERVDNWMKANMSRGAYAALSSVATKADFFVAIEELMQKAGAPAFAIDESAVGTQDVLTEALVRSWQADPKYWDPKQRDITHVEKVQKAWSKLYPDKR